MPKVSNYTRTRIEVLDKQGLPPVAILRSLKNEGLAVSLATRIVKKLRITRLHLVKGPKIFGVGLKILRRTGMRSTRSRRTEAKKKLSEEAVRGRKSLHRPTNGEK